ncbi:MAG: SPFH domain-containing protein [Verrucomicrobiota bacterium]
MTLIDIVQFHGNDQEFVWKFPSENLRLGTQLVVKPAQVAFFVHCGRICDEVKEGTLTLKTGNIPLLTALTAMPFGGDSPFQAEVWFVNLISKLDNLWGTIRPIQLEDPKYGLVVSVRAFGQFGFRIAEPRKFLEGIVGTAKVFTAEQVVEYFKGVLLQAVNVHLGKAFMQERVSVLEAAMHLDALAQQCGQAIQKEFSRFGVELVNFFFHSINIPDEDASYQRLKIIKEKAAELNVLGKDIYQYDRSMEVLKTAAANEGAGAGLMQAGVGLAVGTGIGQQMVQQVGLLVTKLPDGGTPPPVPQAPPLQFNVAANGQSTGPFLVVVLQQMMRVGAFGVTTLVWRQGMAGWQAAGTVPDLVELFAPPTATAPPPVPPGS